MTLAVTRLSAFPDWKKFAVCQKRMGTGCIPTAYEMMLRAAGARNIDFASFQDDFDLDKNGGQPRNHFNSVAEEVKKKYPNVDFACEPFLKGQGNKKLQRVEDLISRGKPVLVSITNEPKNGPNSGWHIMPVVNIENDKLILLDYTDSSGPHTREITKADFVDYHDKFVGGDEIAYLKTA